jgi:hypothetical protein
MAEHQSMAQDETIPLAFRIAPRLKLFPLIGANGSATM